MLIVAGRPAVVFDPGIRFGWPQVVGIPVESIGGMVWAGENVDTTADEYDLTRDQVLVACWWLGIHGAKKWRRRWKVWAQTAHDHMWHGRWEKVTDPPTENEASLAPRATSGPAYGRAVAPPP